MVFDSDNYNVTDFVVAHQINKNNKRVAEKIAQMKADMNELLIRKLRFEASTEAAMGVIKDYVDEGIINYDEANEKYKTKLAEEKAKRDID